MHSPKLIVGLGNPGRDYAGTRHNAGAEAVALFAKEERLVFRAHRAFQSQVAEGLLADDVVFCCLPETYMNLSGEAVAGIVARKKVLLKDVLVVHDEVALPLGALRFKAGGSDAGHNGVASVIERLASRDFARLRIGIGPKPALADLSDFVLSRFPGGEKVSSARVIARAAEAIRFWAREGCPKSMDHYNKKKAEDPREE